MTLDGSLVFFFTSTSLPSNKKDRKRFELRVIYFSLRLRPWIAYLILFSSARSKCAAVLETSVDPSVLRKEKDRLLSGQSSDQETRIMVSWSDTIELVSVRRFSDQSQQKAWRSTTSTSFAPDCSTPWSRGKILGTRLLTAPHVTGGRFHHFRLVAACIRSLGLVSGVSKHQAAPARTASERFLSRWLNPPWLGCL